MVQFHRLLQPSIPQNSSQFSPTDFPICMRRLECPKYLCFLPPEHGYTSFDGNIKEKTLPITVDSPSLVTDDLDDLQLECAKTIARYKLPERTQSSFRTHPGKIYQARATISLAMILQRRLAMMTMTIPSSCFRKWVVD